MIIEAVKGEILKDQQILDAVKVLREESGRKKDKAFLDLRETFNAFIFKLLKKVSVVADNSEERKDLQNWIEMTFFEVLNSKTLRTDDLRNLLAYLKKIMESSINQEGARQHLGKDNSIKYVRNLKIKFSNALKNYHRKYKRLLDFNNATDKKDFSEFMEIKESDIGEVLALVGKDNIKSLSDSIGGDDEGNVQTLLDSLKSDEKLPDEVLKDKELLFILKDRIKKVLSPDQQALFNLYYLNDEDLTKEEVAEKLNMNFRKLRYDLDVAKGKLQKDDKLKSLYYARVKTRLVKIAMSLYNYQIKTSSINFESLISDVLR